MIFNEVNCVVTALEFRVFKNVNQEMNVCFNATNTEFFQATKHFSNRFFVVRAECSCFYEQGIIVRCYYSACESITGVKTNPKPPELRYAKILPVSGIKLFLGSSVVIRHWIAVPLQGISSCSGMPISGLCKS